MAAKTKERKPPKLEQQWVTITHERHQYLLEMELLVEGLEDAGVYEWETYRDLLRTVADNRPHKDTTDE